jgi:hypothetical protein
MHKRLLYLVSIAALCIFCNSIFAAEVESEQESFYSQAPRVVIRLEHYANIQYEGTTESEKVNIPDGTGFFVHSAHSLFIVTARHVAEKKYDLHARVVVRNILTKKTKLFC